ncbi:hypothetical protein [Elongatibacter sediminis]|uniref:Cytochrome c domain-containing protein n=1 Tax=Elongatibacter sediminis TaxID=3119006 RepID=A0AAW9RHP1_9GAMM
MRSSTYFRRVLVAVAIFSAAVFAVASALAASGPKKNSAPEAVFGLRGTSAIGGLFPILGQIERGQETFRFDTFGDESFWTDTLRLNEAVAGEANGGVGPGVSPATALAVGLKVDSEALPQPLKVALGKGEVDLEDPATTLALLQLNAVVGLQGSVTSDGRLESLGVTCALCHSTVDDSFAPGIGKRLDGWANADLDPGLILSLAPDLSALTDLLGVDDATARTVLQSWGPGKFDASLLLDGKAFRPDGGSAAVLIPPAFGLAGVNMHTWTGWGSVTHWNAFVATLEMGGKGTLYDPRLDDAERFPIAAASGAGDTRPDVDLVTPKLADLQLYQLSIPAPRPPVGSFDRRAADRGELVFNNEADCARCHVPPLFTEPGWNMHTPEEMGIDAFQAERGPEDRYRTAPLKGLWTRGKRGYYHDGRFATLDDVVAHYDQQFVLDLTSQQKSDLIEYLKSL